MRRKRPSNAAPNFEPVQRSVYIGRQYLGRYVQVEKTKFEAFDARQRSLGIFRSAAKSVGAISNQIGGAGE
jgi:hypothetical protein